VPARERIMRKDVGAFLLRMQNGCHPFQRLAKFVDIRKAPIFLIVVKGAKGHRAELRTPSLITQYDVIMS
jgi:hypothetical protein